MKKRGHNGNHQYVCLVGLIKVVGKTGHFLNLSPQFISLFSVSYST